MRKGKIMNLMRQYGLPLLVLLLFAGFFFYCSSRVQTDFPVISPENGVADLRNVDFDAGVYHLENHWDYYPGMLYSPEELASPNAPQKSSSLQIDSHLGTWRIVLLAEPETYLSLCSFSVDYSTRIFVDGNEVRNIGFVSDNPDEAVPMVRYTTLPLYSGSDGQIEIVYQYANHIHNQGGFIQNTLISTPENIDEYQRGLSFWSLLLSSGLMFLAFYFLLGAAFQKSKEFAALAFCCLVIAFRNQFFFGEHLLGAGYNFLLEYRFVVLDVSLIPASAIFLTVAFFPHVFSKHRKIVILFTAVFTVLSACHFIVRSQSLVLLCHICYYICALFLLWAIYRFVRYSMYGINDETMTELPLSRDFHFFNPKAGLTYQNHGHTLSASFAIANRDPSRSNYTENLAYDAATKTYLGTMPKAETLYDYELGYQYAHPRFNVGLNLYFMDYDNQLVLTGEYNDVGKYLTTNVKDSYRMGAELTAAVKITDWFRWEGNLVISRNKIQNYKQYIDLYDNQNDWNWIGQDSVVGDVTIAFSPTITAMSLFTFDYAGFIGTIQTNVVGRQFLDNTQDVAAMLRAYTVTNVNLQYSLPMKKWINDRRGVPEVKLLCQLNNIFNAKYASNGGAEASRFADGSRCAWYFAQAGINVHAGFVVQW